MNLIQAIILGVVEGVTEFLPISSTGHMILASKLMGLQETDFVKTFEIFIQLGAILAVVVLYFKKLITSKDTIKKIIIAFIPTAIIGLVLHGLVKKYLLGSSVVVSVSLIVGGILIIWFEKWNEKKNREKHLINNQGNVNDKNKVSRLQAFKIGLYQSI